MSHPSPSMPTSGVEHQIFASEIDGFGIRRSDDWALPEGEKLDIRSVWVAEAYTDPLVEELIQSFVRLGWSSRDAPIYRENHPDDWLRGRQSGWDNGQFAFGYIAPRGEADEFKQPGYVADFPSVVDYAIANLLQIAPGLYVLVVQFLLRPVATNSVLEKLTSHYDTYVTPGHQGVRVWGDLEQCQRAVDGARSDLLNQCSSWLQDNLPGIFSRAEARVTMPSVEFLTLRMGTVSSPHEIWEMDDYRNLLRLQHATLPLQSRSYPALKIRIASDADALGFHIRAFANEPEFENAMYGDSQNKPKRNGLTESVIGIILPLIEKWTALQVLTHFETSYFSLRSMAGSMSELLPDDDTVTDLFEVEREVLGLSAEAVPVASEIHQAIESGQFSDAGEVIFDIEARIDINDFARLPLGQPLSSLNTVSEPYDLIDTIIGNCEASARRVINLDHTLVKLVTSQSSTIRVQLENIRIKEERATRRSLNRLSWIVGIATVLGVIVAAVQLYIDLGN